MAPWRSVFKFHLFSGAEITFVLTSGGHNAGILSEPHHQHRHFRIGTRQPAWGAWLLARSGAVAEPPSLGDSAAGFPPPEDAPRRYVLMK